MSPKGESFSGEQHDQPMTETQTNSPSRSSEQNESLATRAFRLASEKKQQRETDAQKIVETALRLHKGDVRVVQTSIDRQLEDVAIKIDLLDREDPQLSNLKESLKAQKRALEKIPDVSVIPITDSLIKHVDIPQTPRRETQQLPPSSISDRLVPSVRDRVRGGWNRLKDWFIPTPQELTTEQKKQTTQFEKIWTADRLGQRAEDVVVLNTSIQENVIARSKRVLDQLTDRRTIVLATMNRRGKASLPEHLMKRYQTELASLQKRIQETSIDLRAARASQRYKSGQEKAA